MIFGGLGEVFWVEGGFGDNMILGGPLHPPSLTTEAAQHIECAVLLRAANTLQHIAAAPGVGRAFILKVKKLLNSGQGLDLPKRCVRKRSER